MPAGHISEYTFRETTTGDLLAKRFLLFAELAGFDKDLDDCVTALDISESELKSIIDAIDSK